MVQQDGEDQLDRSCKKWRHTRYSQRVEEYLIYNKKRRNVNWIGHVLRSNCLLKHMTEEKRAGEEQEGSRSRKT